MAEHMQVWDSSTLSGATPPPPFSLPNYQGCSIKLTNNSRWTLLLIKSGAGIPFDKIPPASYLIFPYTPDVTVKVDPNTPASTSLVPDVETVEYATMDGSHTYAHGSTNFDGQTNVTVNGGTVNASITNSQIDVNITGTPTMNLASGAAVNATIQGTPTMNLAPGTAVNATIENATLNSNVTNALLQTGVSGISSQQSFNISNLAVNASTSCIVSVPPNIYDSFQIIVYSASNQLNLFTFNLAQVRYEDGGMGGKATWYAPPTTLQFSFPYNADNSSTTSTSAPIGLNGSFFGNEIVIQVVNKGSNPLTDVLKFVVIGKYATQSISYSTPNHLLAYNMTFAAESIQAGQIGVVQYTPALQIANAKKILVYVSSNGVGYTSNQYGIKVLLQGAYDTNYWFNSGSNSTFPDNLSVEKSGYVAVVLDSSIMPQLINGSPYLRFEVYQYNNYTQSCNISNSNVGFDIYAIY